MAKYRVSTPVPDFSGEVGGCAFVDGVYEGEVPDGPLAYFTNAGYSVEKSSRRAKQEPVAEPEPTPDGLDPAQPADDASADTQENQS